MINFKEYFKLITESPTGIKYGDKLLYMHEAAITFITTPDDFYAFQTVSTKAPKLLHINNEFKVVETPELIKDTDEMYHENLGTIFGLDLYISEYKRGRLWIDPNDNTRILVSLWSFKEEFLDKYAEFFEAVVKKMLTKASEFVYEFEYSRPNMNFAQEVKIRGITPNKKTEEEKLKERRVVVFGLWHTKTGDEKLKLEKEGDEINKKLGLTDAPWAYKRVQTPKKSSEPSWKTRIGD
jgi:hypothetical protein